GTGATTTARWSPRASTSCAPRASADGRRARASCCSTEPPGRGGAPGRAHRGGAVKIATLADAAVGHTRRWVESLTARGHEVRLWSLEPAPQGLEAHALPSLPVPGLLRYPLAL